MTAPSDPRAVALSYRVYRALLRAYPRRFRFQYREEMALVFRDSCRDSYRRKGWKGVIAVWWRCLADLSVNAPKELTVAMVEEPEALREGCRCSACNNEVDCIWQRCRYCGSSFAVYSPKPPAPVPPPMRRWHRQLLLTAFVVNGLLLGLSILLMTVAHAHVLGHAVALLLIFVVLGAAWFGQVEGENARGEPKFNRLPKFPNDRVGG